MERRHVTILFADLVGFTARSDGSDPEAVREFLSSYFELARETVQRYGGTVEKFIGDAVMAVWGTPIVREDDPERAVRAALDLVDAIPRLGREAGDASLEMRAGVLTGEAAVDPTATGQAMVAGDLVNTASRLQSVAPPGTVLVGESTFRAASAAIAFEPAGDQLLKGKSLPIPAWRALRVVAERGGRGRSDGLEAPFVGRDAELRLLKDRYHATARERKARLVSITGHAGIGKSRLAWELSKYIDGLVDKVWWHEGRSPAYGDGITFWALGEMVRRRAGLAEEDDETATRERIAATVSEFVLDDAERRRVELALLALLGVEAAPPGGREELFAAWRTFFERLAATDVVVLVFHDLHWADVGLLDFIEYLLEWSANHPIYVLTLARPEILDRRRDWAVGRNSVALSLEPLPEDAMRGLLAGLVPGLPESSVRTILHRAAGIPLYAVETIRMLLTEGRLEEADGIYRPVGDLSHLAVPESLHGLIAARLDSLDPSDRALLQDASVLGQTFSVQALGALTGDDADVLEPRLRTLVRRELLVHDTDPRSPERGQYGFTQALIGEVAYSTIARRDRRARHLAAARYFEGLGDEAAGILATHYLDAYLVGPEGPESDALAIQARIALRSAAERANDLGSPEQAITYLQRALEITSDQTDEADLLERLGAAATAAARFDLAQSALRRALDIHRSRGDRAAVARAGAALGQALTTAYRIPDALAVLTPLHAELADLGDDPGLIALTGVLARARFLNEELAAAIELADQTLVSAERLDLVPVIAEVMLVKGGALANSGRMREGTALVEAGLNLAERAGLTATVVRAQIVLSAVLSASDPKAAVAVGLAGFEEARRLGLRHSMVVILGNAAEAALPIGSWPVVTDELERLLELEHDSFDLATAIGTGIELRAVQGLETADRIDRLASLANADDVSTGPIVGLARLWAAYAEGRFEDAIDAAIHVAAINSLNAPYALVPAGHAAIRLNDAVRTADVLSRLIATGVRGTLLDAQRASIAAGLASLEGRWPDAAAMYRDALRRLRDLGVDFEVALVDLDILAVAPPGDPLATNALREAREILERVGARPFVRQLDELLARRGEPTPADRGQASPDRDSLESRSARPA